MALKIVMIAGEASGDQLGGRVLAALRHGHADLDVTGIGGETMQAQGLKPVFPMADLTVMGLSHAIKSYRRLKRRAAELIDHIMTSRPDVIVTIDNKGFSLRLGKALKARMANEGWSVPIVHLVAPTVWAWGAWRAKSIAQSVDRLLCLFPFEVPFFTRYGVDAIAVGHPAREENRLNKTQARQNLGMDADDLILVLLPGSRQREISNLLPVMLDAVKIIRHQEPNLKVILPAASSVASLVDGLVASDDHIQVLDQSQSQAVMAAGDYGLICSGTVTLESALSGLEGHVYYRADLLTLWLGKMMIDRSKIVLANAISGHQIYPLSLNNEFSAKTMAEDVLDHLTMTKTVTEHSGSTNAKSLQINKILSDALTPKQMAANHMPPDDAIISKNSFAENTAKAILNVVQS